MQKIKSVENTRRELFEAWAISHASILGYSFPDEVAQLNGLGDYAIVWVQGAWLGFNAALDSVVIELPQAISEFNTNSDGYVNPVAVEYDECIQDFRDAIESTNLGIKVK